MLFDENGFGNNRPCAAGTGEANYSDNQMEKKDSQIAHGASYQDCESSKNACKIAIRHALVPISNPIAGSSIVVACIKHQRLRECEFAIHNPRWLSRDTPCSINWYPRRLRH